MYHPAIIAAHESRFFAEHEGYRKKYPHGLPTYSVADTVAITEYLTTLRLEDGSLKRPLTDDEDRFTEATALRCGFDFPYFARRFVYIDDEGQGLRPLYPLWESQEFMLDQLARLELKRHRDRSPDGLLLNILKIRQVGVCLAPETRVLTADLRWKAIGNIAVGDELVAVDEFPPGGRGDGREMKTATVEAIRTVFEPAYELTFDTGVRVIATGPHRWLSRRRSGTDTCWRAVQNTMVGDVVRMVTQPWGPSTVEDGWMGGIIDGEGSFKTRGAGAEVQVIQRYGPVYDRVTDYFEARNYASFHAHPPDDRTPENSSKFGREPVGRVGVARMNEIFRLLGQTRPTRFIERRWWEGKELPGKRNGTGWARVVEIRPVGEIEAIDLQTSTQTFIAEGLVSHNSTMSLALNIHRPLTRKYVRALVGSDVEPQAAYLFRMGERVEQNLPWFLKRNRIGYNKDREILWDNHSSIRTAWGKTTRGALQEVGGRKGNIERGRTYSDIHVSELATWDNPDQLDSALLPGIPYSPQTLVIFESTAELSEDWWHKHWQATARGEGRFNNLFIAAYAVPSKYSLPPPVGWEPRPSTKQWEEKAIRESPLWCLGATIRPTREQMYWYESTRAFYEAKGKLHDFLREYPSDPEECFQYAGRSIFTLEQLAAIDAYARPRPIDVWFVEPAKDIAALRRIPETDPAEDKRPAPPLTPELQSRLAPETNPVPPGFGFRRVPLSEVRLRTEAGLEPHKRYESFLTIWEYPRSRGPHSYVLASDVGDGVGMDYSVIDIIRVGTVEEGAEQVAQFVSNMKSPQELAGIADAIGRFYCDGDHIEALAAIECNIGPGMVTQDNLQAHLGYTNFYVWQVLDAISVDKRFTTRIGWATNSRTRPVIISQLQSALTTADDISGALDLRLNSLVSRYELRHLIIPPVVGARLGDAEAAPGQHDDAVMTAAIGYFVAYMQAGGETEPIAEKRRRRTAIHALAGTVNPPDWRNTAVTSEEADHGHDEDDDLTTDDAGLYFDHESGGRDRA